MLFISPSIWAKDYFGVTFNQDTAQDICQKASYAFADCVIEGSGDAVVQGNGLLRLFNPHIASMRVHFDATGKVQQLILLTRSLPEEARQALLAHLQEDYDLSQLYQLGADQLVDIRHNLWSIQPVADQSEPYRYQIQVIYAAKP